MKIANFLSRKQFAGAGGIALVNSGSPESDAATDIRRRHFHAQVFRQGRIDAGPEFELLVNEIVREMTVKAGSLRVVQRESQ